MLMFNCKSIFTHGPIVGHGGGATHDVPDIMIGPDGELIPYLRDQDAPFVEWVNGPGMTVEAVFCGHTHEDHIFWKVTESNMDYPEDIFKQYDILPSQSLTINFEPVSGTFYGPVFIETNTACKGYP